MLCYLERALTRKQTNNKSFTTPVQGIPNKYCSEFYQDDIGFSAEIILWKGFFGQYVFRG
jgi:hypothetical protein